MPLFDPHALLRVARNRSVRIASGVGLALYLAYHLTRFRLTDVWPIAPAGGL